MAITASISPPAEGVVTLAGPDSMICSPSRPGLSGVSDLDAWRTRWPSARYTKFILAARPAKPYGARFLKRPISPRNACFSLINGTRFCRFTGAEGVAADCDSRQVGRTTPKHGSHLGGHHHRLRLNAYWTCAFCQPGSRFRPPASGLSTALERP